MGFGNGVWCWWRFKSTLNLSKGLLSVAFTSLLYFTSLPTLPVLCNCLEWKCKGRDTIKGEFPSSCWDFQELGCMCQAWHPAVLLWSLPTFVAWSILVSLRCILLLTAGLYWGEKRNVTLSSLSDSLGAVVLFFSSTSPCLKGISEEVMGIVLPAYQKISG